MEPDAYTVIYNAAQHPFSGWLVGVYFVVFAMGIVAFGLAEKGVKRWLLLGGATVFAAVGGLATWGSWSEHVKLKSKLLSGEFTEVEGLAALPDGETVAVANHRFGRDRNVQAFPRPIDLVGRCMRVLFYSDEFGREQVLWVGIRDSACRTQAPIEQDLMRPNQ